MGSRNVPVPIAEGIVQIEVPNAVIRTIVGVTAKEGKAHCKSLCLFSLGTPTVIPEPLPSRKWFARRGSRNAPVPIAEGSVQREVPNAAIRTTGGATAKEGKAVAVIVIITVIFAGRAARYTQRHKAVIAINHFAEVTEAGSCGYQQIVICAIAIIRGRF